MTAPAPTRSDRDRAEPRGRARRRLALGDEVLFILAAALLLLVLLSTFTLVAYRSALELLAEERRDEAARLAGHAAAALAVGRPPAAGELARLAPQAVRVVLVGADGAVVAETGAADAAGGPPLAPLAAEPGGGRPAEPTGLGPGGGLGGVVAGFASISTGGRSRVVRVDLPAAALAAQLRGVRVLTVVVGATDVAVVALLVVFLRRRLQPLGRLVERARRLSPEEGGEAELAVLLGTFERALAALEAPAAGEPATEDDIAALSRTLARSLASGVLLLDDRGRVAALNRVGAELLGVPPPAPGTPVGEALAAHPELAALLAGAAAGDEGVQRREVAIGPAPAAAGGPGGRMTLGITVHPLRRDDGEVRGHLALFADLTESVRRAEEARLAESLVGLGELAAGVAHELRNSLATLRGYLTLIERSPRSPGGEETAADYLGEIRRETDHLQRVLEDFLTFARPGTARLEPVELLEVARRAAGDPALAGVAVEVTDRRGRPVRVHGDPQLLERAVRNLLHNAAQAVGGAGGGPLEVGLERRPEGLALTVDDRGPGLPDEIRERLFQPFATARPGGVGLGLALTRRIVTLHGGVLRLDDRPGGGTRATIVFPVDVLVTIGNNPSDSPTRHGGGEAASSHTE